MTDIWQIPASFALVALGLWALTQTVAIWVRFIQQHVQRREIHQAHMQHFDRIMREDTLPSAPAFVPSQAPKKDWSN